MFSNTFNLILFNLLTLKIWLSILPSTCNCDTFPCKLIMRIRCSIKVINCTWWVRVFSIPVCCIMYGYYREKLHANHFWELRAKVKEQSASSHKWSFWQTTRVSGGRINLMRQHCKLCLMSSLNSFPIHSPHPPLPKESLCAGLTLNTPKIWLLILPSGGFMYTYATL